jgi:RND family efflux transporter MFP subunit
VVLEVKGYLVPASQVTVTPTIAGQVVEMRIEEGKQVKEGDVLARLDATEQEAALKLAQAKLQLAEARLAKAKAAPSRGDVAIAQARVKVAQAQIVLAEHRVQCTVIRAPVSGTVLVKRAEVGSWIEPKGNQVYANLCDLANLRKLDVEIWAPEKEFSKVFQGQSCVIQMEAVPSTSYKGQVVRILPVADRAKGAFGLRVRVDVPEKDHRLRPELSALVQFIAKK